MEVCNQVDYIHWYDPNEPVDRLRYLVAEQQAGHTCHSNKIVFIIKEIRESNYIV